MDLVCWFVLMLVPGFGIVTWLLWLELQAERERSANFWRRAELLKAELMRHGLEP